MSGSLFARELTLHRGRQLVLDSVTVALDPGHRVGLVGPNGVGKSTLLNVLAGLLVADAGRVERRPREATVGLLAQEPERRPGETVRDMVSRRTGITQINIDLDAAAEALGAGVDGATETYSEVLEAWCALGADDFEGRLATVWHDLALLLEKSRPADAIDAYRKSIEINR